MFLHLSVDRGVGFPACITGHMTRVSASGGSAFRGFGRPPGMPMGVGLHPGGVWQTPPGDTMGYYGIQSTSGQYTSYWNAFLFVVGFFLHLFTRYKWVPVYPPPQIKTDKRINCS